MLSKLRARLTYANVLSTLTAFVVLAGGTAVAVPGGLVTKDDIGANAVGRSEIKTDAVKKAEVGSNAVGDSEVRENSVDTSEVENGSLLADDFAPGQFPAGLAGPPGPQGPAGKDGVDGTGGGGGGAPTGSFGDYTRTDVRSDLAVGGEQVLFSKTPFTVTAKCVDDQQNPGTFFSAVTVTTSQNDQAWTFIRPGTRPSTDPDFDANEEAAVGGVNFSGFATVAPLGEFVAIGSGGTLVQTNLWAGAGLFGTSGCNFGGTIDSK